LRVSESRIFDKSVKVDSKSNLLEVFSGRLWLPQTLWTSLRTWCEIRTLGTHSSLWHGIGVIQRWLCYII